MAARPSQRLVSGQLSMSDLEPVGRWISLNKAALIDYWEYRIGPPEFVRRLQRLLP
jgi:hypothetical protein